MKNEKKKNTLRTNLKKTWKYVKEGKRYLLVYLFISVLEAVISAILPLCSAKIILNITDGLIDQLLYTALSVLAIEVLLYTTWLAKTSCYRKIYHIALTNLQIAVARETLKLEISEIDKSSSGVFIDRLNKDTQDISGIFMDYTYWLSNVISNIGVLVAIFALNKYFFVYALFTSTLVFLINKKRLAKQYDIQKNLKKLQEKKTGLTSELVRGIRDIKVLNAAHNILHATEEKIRETSTEEIHMINIRTKYNYLESNTRAFTDFLLLILGCFLYERSLLSIPAFVVIYNYQGKIKSLLTGLVYILEYNKKFSVSSERIFEIIDDDTFQKEHFGDVHVPKLTGDIEFKDVIFSYDGKHKILDKMNFHIAANQKVAFVGKSGAGKTTIFSLIARLYEKDKGKILLDGYDLEKLDESSLRDNMSIITQNPYIFNFSIKDNLLIAKADASMKEMREACKLACIDDFIMKLPQKYDTHVGENGIILSGGQKQRLAIARALLMKTEIILFDEATSALDNETQDEIQKAIANLKGEYTILVVAHRLSTVIDSDKIFVVDEGKIVASGTHKELLKKCEIYRNLYEKDLQA